MSPVWVDVDNPPQAQYLSPVARGLRDRGHRVLVTARDDPATLAVLAARGETAVPLGGPFGPSGAAKAAGTVRRSFALAFAVRRRIGRPSAAVATSRSGVIAARTMGVPAFTILDYEGAELGVYRRTGTTVLHPAAVAPERFAERGLPAGRLIAFPGLKEDISLRDLDPEPAPVTLPPPRRAGLPAILVRPPSETSHYRSGASVRVLRAVLRDLSRRGDLQVVFSPRQASQTEMVSVPEWSVPPVILERPVPAAGLFAAVDHVITGGGTMLREAAWFGVPASTVFQGPPPAVDEWLERRGAVRRITEATDLAALEWTGGRSRELDRHPEALDRVLDEVERAISGRSRS